MNVGTVQIMYNNGGVLAKMLYCKAPSLIKRRNK